MLRSILSIILLIMIFITASGMPLYADTINFNFILPISTSKEDFTILDTNITMISPSHAKAQVGLMANEKFLPLQLNDNNPITISLYSDDFIMDYNISEIDISQKDDVQIEFDLLQEFCNIPNGDYQLKISINIEDVESPITSPMIPLNFSREFTYIKGSKNITKGQSALTLYFPDNNIQSLTPITRFIPYTQGILRNTVIHLAKGPSPELGLAIGPPIPDIKKLNLKNGILSLYLPGNIGIYDEYSASARIAVDSLVNSLTAVEGVKGLQFYFDNKIISDSFHGIAMNEPIYSSDTPKAYVALISDTQRAFLTPKSMDMGTPSIEEVFETLKYNTPLIQYNYTLQPTIPKEVVLLDYTIEGNTLQLQLSEDFLKVYKDNPDKRNLMVDSIIHTFASLDDIDSVLFKVSNYSSPIPKGILLNEVLFPSPYINVEK